MRQKIMFLAGTELTAAIKRLSKHKGPLKYAVAYWGKDGLQLTGIDPRRRNARVICCLKGGKSDPDLIRRFGKRAKQHDQLHAKVFWTKEAAIVGSANASSNGMPEEEDQANGLIETGILVTEPSQLKHIEAWFDRLFRTSSAIKANHLDAAREARKRRMFGAGKAKKQPLLKALREGGKLEFGKQNISIALWNEATSKEQDAAATAYAKAHKGRLADAYKVDTSQLGKLDWFVEWPGLPRNSFLIDCECTRRTIKRVSIKKTFATTKHWTVSDGSEEQLRVVFVARKPLDFQYLLTRDDVRTLKAKAKALWKLGIERYDGKANACIFPLQEAVPLLLK